ncbi:MAG TPA: DNA polymerase III subunit gamma/tau [Bacteroidia bacterium]|nr:DNA polymerase III subunit gamma/tau [Bacteroidia bacterium]
MNHFVVSARKYRPPIFDMVVGQDSITTTLKNAIKNKHLAQAFLFCGPRGVGKTTCARILAKTINCENISEQAEACNTCESCQSFNSNQSLNIYELDAASNNSVDDIRSLVEQVRYAPHKGQYKIYIIDEVHMLSSGAFNAFLKTLEEPPDYAIFILATTEKHKIIPTILSRCQIFDFNRIQVEDIAQHLQYVAKNEDVVAEPDALHLIALKSDGALRDALSIFDQLVSFSGRSITYKDVVQNLNVLDYDYYFKLTKHFTEGDFASSLLLFDEIMQDGFDAHQFINGLSTHFRDLMVCKNKDTISLLEVAPSIKNQYQIQSEQIAIKTLIHFLKLTNECDVQYRQAKNQRLHIELCLIKLCSVISEITDTTDANIVAEPKRVEYKKSVASEKLPEKKEEKPISNHSVEKKVIDKDSDGSLERETISLKKKSKVESAPVVVQMERSNPFSFDQLTLAWAELLSLSQTKGKKMLAFILENHKPEESGLPNLKVILDNVVQEEQLKEEQEWVMEFIRNTLENDHILLEVEIRAFDEVKKIPYTGQEKFEELAQSNPVLLDLQKQFKLDIL